MDKNINKNQILNVIISDLGIQGDGIAEFNGNRIFVPFSIPGDRVKVRVYSIKNNAIYANIESIIEASNNRQDPLCKHFGHCGGCTVQHLNKNSYNHYKLSMLFNAVDRLGVDRARIADICTTGTYSRRRAELKVSINKGKVALGFFAAKSHDVVDMLECFCS